MIRSNVIRNYLVDFSRIYASLARRESDIPGFSRAALDRDESLSAYESSLRFYEHTVNYKLHFLAADRLKAAGYSKSGVNAEPYRKRKRSNYPVGKTPRARHFAPCTVSLFFCSLSPSVPFSISFSLSFATCKLGLMNRNHIISRCATHKTPLNYHNVFKVRIYRFVNIERVNMYKRNLHVDMWYRSYVFVQWWSKIKSCFSINTYIPILK